MKKTDNLPLIALAVMTAFIISCINHFDTPNSAKTPPLAKGMGRVEVTIAGSDARTLLPDVSEITSMALDYKLTITKGGADTPAVNVTFNGNNWTGDLEAGDYTAEIIAVKSGTSQTAARGNKNFTVNSNSTSAVNVTLTTSQEGNGIFSYAVNIADGITITNGGIQFVSLSQNPNPASVIFTGSNLSGNVNIASGYYRVNLCLVDTSGGQVKMYETTAAAHIAGTLTTRAVYNVTENDFNRRDDVVVDSAGLTAKLAEIKAKPAGEYVINVAGIFRADPILLWGYEGFNNKTIILRGYGNAEIILKSADNGPLFELSGQSSQASGTFPVTLILENIILRGVNNNYSYSVVKVNPYCKLVLRSGGKITGNTITRGSSSSPLAGAGVSVKQGTLEIAGGEIFGNSIISGNSSNNNYDGYGGGVYADNYSTVLMTGGAVRGNSVIVNSNNKDGYGGGIYFSDSCFEMTGGVIEDNVVNAQATTRDVYGGGVYFRYSYSTNNVYYFYFKGGKIRNNTCNGNNKVQGGGICIYNNSGNDSSGFFMSGGVISGNNCVSTNANYCAGGGVFTEVGKILKTGGIIYGNDVTGNDADGIPLMNTRSGNANMGGHAVYAGSYGKFRNTTAWENNNLDSAVRDPTGGWYGDLINVIYNANGGIGNMANSTHAIGYTTLPNPPLTINKFYRTDYIFAGWALTPGGTVWASDGDTVKTWNLIVSAGGTITLYAVWKPED